MKEILLIRRAVRGDREALEQLVRLYYGKIYNYIFYRVSDPMLAEDLTQDVFVKLTKNMHSYVPTAPFSAFLYRIARNAVIDHFRTAKQTEELPQALPAADVLGQAEARLDVIRILTLLPEEQRECIILHYLQELSFREIAQILAIPIPTAKSRVQRGLAACKKLMEEHHDG